MAGEDTTEEDPSIEEILDSIRQIISDEDEEGGEQPAEAGAGDDAGEDDDVLDLTEKVEDDASFAEEVEAVSEEPEAPAPEPEPEPEPEPASEPEEQPEEKMEIDMTEPEEEPQTPAPDVQQEESAPEPEATPTPAPVQDSSESILTNKAQDAAYSGFSELVKKTAVEGGGITLEEIVRSELNPLLRDWLDKYLPSIIERLVQEELERIAKRTLDN